MSGTIRILAATLILVLGICLAGCAGTQTHSGELQILSHSMTVHEFSSGTPQGTAVVKGRAKNVSDYALDLASIRVDFYDKNGGLLKTSSAIRQNLGPGEIWDFNVQFSGPDAWKSINYDIAASTEQ